MVVLYEKLLCLLLLMGCVESNPGPRKKASTQARSEKLKQHKRCEVEKCSRLVSSGSSKCNVHRETTIDSFTSSNVDTSSVALQLTSVLDENYELQSVSSTEWLQTACEIAKITFHKNINFQLESGQDLTSLVPSTTYKILGDGNCLFGSLSAALSGSEQFKRDLRYLICDRMLTAPITTQQFATFTEKKCHNASEYLSKNSMQQDRVWGGDLEVAVFCYLFNVEVIVYVLSMRQWVAYLKNSFSNKRNIFLVNWGNHWEPLRSVSSQSDSQSLFITSVPLFDILNSPVSNRKRSLLPTEPEHSTTAKRSRTNISTENNFYPVGKSSQFPEPILGIQHCNSSIDFDVSRSLKVHDITKCQKCQRTSTLWYPLQLTPIHDGLAAKRKYGKAVVGSSCNLCTQCYSYVTKQPNWGDAWPSVLYTLCFVTKNKHVLLIFKKLPIQIQASWLFTGEDFGVSSRNYGVFQDISRDIVEHRRLIGTYLVSDFKNAMSRYSFPSVQCFCGASEFIDTVGCIQLQHLINYADETFTAFKANWRSNLRCIRADYLDRRDQKLAFLFRPAVVVASNGLCLASCELHSKGSKKKLVHAPNHPVVSNLSHPRSDRFAPLVSSLRGAKPTKIGQFSNTFTMSKSVGGTSGVGSITLHSFRDLNVKSDFLLPAIESTFFHNRPDMTENLTSIGNEHNMSEEMCEGYVGEKLYNDFQLRQSLKAASYIPMSTTVLLKNKNDEADDDSPTADKLNIPQTDMSTQGELPHLPSNRLLKKYYFISMLVILFSSVSELCNLLLSDPTPLRCLLNKAICAPKESTFVAVSESLGLSTNSKFDDCWKSLQTVLSNFRVVEKIDFDTFNDEVHFLVLLNKRPKSTSLAELMLPEAFQINATETVPGRNKFNLRIYKRSPVNSTLDCNLFDRDVKKSFCEDFDTNIGKVRVILVSKRKNVPNNLINLFSGQQEVKCPQHGLAICSDYKDSGSKCTIVRCQRQSKWRCPSKHCLLSTCLKHFQEIRDSGLWPPLKKEYALDNDETQAEPNQLEEDIVADDSDPFHDALFLGPSCSDYLMEVTADTDAGDHFVPIETVKDDGDYLPVQLLFNVFLAVLNRPKSPIKSNLKFRRFMQSFVTRNSKCSISLMQPESLLFPSIFFKQVNDGTALGAIPWFLFASDSKCATYGYGGLLEHFRSRITDISLLTSSNHTYIQFAVDCLINLQLKQMHSKVFFQRGLQSLKLYGEETKVFSKCLTTITNDTDKCVRQLSAAIASMPVTFFLTITCNQRDHPATKQLWKAIDEFYSGCSDEIKRSAFSSYLTTMVRCWSRSVRYLFDLILNSPERILGKVVKIWGRAEFQTTVGNLPHYHILLWVEPGTFNIDELIQCSEKSILHSLNELCHTSLNLINSTNLWETYEKMVRIHTHNCERGGYRCHKRKDVDGNVVCRTPPNPQSHHHWKMKITQQYPEGALNLLEQLNLAERDETGAVNVTGPLTCEKYMYAAENGEHILPTSSKLFALTESSVNLLRTTERFSSSYLSSYAGKAEEHADGSIRSANNGKSFRLRDDGIQNRGLATVKFAIEAEKQRCRPLEAVHCQLLAITESIFWLLAEPYVITNMVFKHIQNVPMEKRFVRETKTGGFLPLDTLNVLTFRDYVPSLPHWKKLTRSQRILVSDANKCNETLDYISQFSLRPPELLCIRKVKQYVQWFCICRKENSVNDLLRRYEEDLPVPFVTCYGSIVKVYSKALPLLLDYLRSNQDNFSPFNLQRSHYVQRCLNDSPHFYVLDSTALLPEIVFRSIPPRDTLDFLISFILRFGDFETELDLFYTSNLLECFKFSGLLPDKNIYSEQDVLNLLKEYVQEELIYLPGGVLSFTAKLFSAKLAFSQLLNLDGSGNDGFCCPTVLVSEMHTITENVVSDYIAAVQEAMCERVRTLGLPNLPSDPLDNRAFWEPVLPIMEGQLIESFCEQQQVLRKVANAIILKFSSSVSKVKHQIIMGRPGTGKTHLSGVLLAQALCNGLVSYLTSLPSRRAIQLYGEHIHRLFRISTKNMDSESLSNEALVKLSHDHKRRTLLQKLQVLFVEEISLINAETWSAMDLILRKLRDSAESFGGVLVVANGDCCQLPNISGYNIFEACSFLFNFDFHFLQEFVRMEDPLGQELLKLLESRPIAEEDIERVIEIVSKECNFIEKWEDLTDRLIMKVFGKRSAEQEAFQLHCKFIEENVTEHSYSLANDEISTEGTHCWRTAGRRVKNYLNKCVTEYEKLLFYPGCILRATQNLEGIQQGQLCILDFLSVSDCSIHVYVAPTLESVNERSLADGDFLFWPKIRVRKSPGYVQKFRNSSVRRTQFPVANYVALTVHRLMGDTFIKLATEISSAEKKYALWLISQFYVIVSRVRYLIQLYFVGNKMETLSAIRNILLKRNLAEERLFELFQQIRRAAIEKGPGVIQGPRYLRNHFEVPSTPNGYVYLLVSVRTMCFNTFYVGETSDGLSAVLRQLNSTDVRNASVISRNQPWAVGFFYWNFENDDERFFAHRVIQNILLTTDHSFEALKNYCNFALREMSHIKMCVCGRIVSRLENETPGD